MSDQKPGKIISIDMLRGIAAFCVAWFHFTNGNPNFLSGGILKASGSWGWLGVEMFFVISGFVIPYALWQSSFNLKRNWFRFLLKRIARIDPPYLVSILLSLGLWFISSLLPFFKGNPVSIHIPQIMAHLGYLVDFLGMDWFQPIYWSLAIEFQYYILIMLIIPLLIHSSYWKSRGAILILILFPLIGFSKIVVFYWLALFSVGILSFLYFIDILKIREYLILMTLASVSCVFSIGLPELIAGLFSVLFIFGLKNVSFKPLVFLGSISYSLYLIHIPIGGRIINLATRFESSVEFQLIFLVAAVVVSLFFSWLFYRWIEKPSLTLASKILYKK